MDDHSPEYTAPTAAEDATEALRALCHLTLSRVEVIDVYQIIGSLSTVPGRLAQALEQLANALDRDAGGYAADGYATETAPALAAAGAEQLRAAAAVARGLNAPIDAAHSAVAHLYVPTPVGE